MRSDDLYQLAKLRTAALAMDSCALSLLAGLDLQGSSRAAPRRAVASTRDGRGRETILCRGVMEGGAPGILTALGLGFATQTIESQLSLAVLDDRVDEIVLSWDSPGGSVEGVPELVAAVRRAGRTKGITSMVEYTCASAALWVAAQADRIICAPSGTVGSIGVYTQHTDESKALEMAGVKITLVSAGRFKVEDTSTRPLSESAAERMQQQVNAIYDQFVADVARGRNVPIATVLRDYGQGRMLSATEAKRVGLVDYIAPSVEAAPVSKAIAQKRTAAMARRM